MLSIQIFPQSTEEGYENNTFCTDGEELILKSFLKPGDRVFDVGANNGDWALLALNIHSDIRLNCFEPVPIHFQQLALKLTSFCAKNISPFRRELNMLAISDHQGKGEMFFIDDIFDQGCSLIYRSGYPSHKQITQVELDTLDHFCGTHEISKIDFLKIDVEGSELNVLKGANHLLSNHQIIALQFEYGGTYPDAGITLKEVMRMLTSAGYSIFRLCARGLIHISHWEDSLECVQLCNYFAIIQSEVPNYQRVTFYD